MSISNEQVVAFLKKNPIGVGCGVLSLLMAAAIYFRSDQLPAAQAVLDQKSTEADRHAINVRYAVQLKEQLEALNTADRAIDARLVRAAQLATNTQYFYRLETDTGVKLLNISQTTTTAQAAKMTKTNFVPIGFNLNAQGTYLQLLDLLHRLENGAHYCRIISANTVKVGSGGDNDLLTLGLSVELLGER
jgi:hypothetical protein